MTVIRRYTREAGVRNLEREIAAICRKIAREVVSKKNGQENRQIKVTAKTVQKFLGPPRYKLSQIEEKDHVGLVTGMAWTQIGGELLGVETLVMPGKGRLTVTGHLGDVMKESAQAAGELCALQGLGASYRRQLSSKFRYSHPCARGRHSQGWPVGRDHHVHLHCFGPDPATGSSGSGHDRRADPARARSAHWRTQGKNTCRPSQRHPQGVDPGRKPKGHQGHPASIRNQIEIALVEHMDEVLPQALVLEDGDVLFKENDITFAIVPPEEVKENPSAIH